MVGEGNVVEPEPPLVVGLGVVPVLEMEDLIEVAVGRGVVALREIRLL